MGAHNELIADQEFIELFETVGPRELARKLGYSSSRPVFSRRERLERRLKRKIHAPKDPVQEIRSHESPVRLHLKVDSGMVLVGSDSHYHPGEPSTAHRAFVRFCKEYKQQLRAV